MDLPTPNQGGKTRETIVGSQKPLHRFLNGEPKSLGIAVLFFGCGEVLMGIPLATVGDNSTMMYIPFWLGALVTVCLSMYVVTLLGIFVSLCFRLFVMERQSMQFSWSRNIVAGQILTAEIVLLSLTLCICPVLIFLACRARAALKSTKTQVMIQQHLPSGE